MLLTYEEGSKKFKEKVFDHIKKKLNKKIEYLRVWIHTTTTSANNNPKRKSEDLSKINSNKYTKALLILIQKPDIKNPNYFNIKLNDCIIKPDIKDKLKN